MKPKRKTYFINRTFQAEFILKFCALIVIGCILFGLILYIFSSHTLTTAFTNSRLVVKSTADYLLPGILFGGVIVGVIMAIASSIVVVFMTHRIVGPAYRFEKYAQKIGAGELFTDLKIRRKDQFQNLVNVFNKMTKDLNAGVSKVKDVSEKLGSLIEKLSDSTDNELLLKEDIKKIVSELKKDKQDLKSAISYFKLRH